MNRKELNTATFETFDKEEMYITSKQTIVFEGKFREALIQLIREEFHKECLKQILDNNEISS